MGMIFSSSVSGFSVDARSKQCRLESVGAIAPVVAIFRDLTFGTRHALTEFAEGLSLPSELLLQIGHADLCLLCFVIAGDPAPVVGV
jgi:hypothetical protein